jgi:hypothetical protein
MKKIIMNTTAIVLILAGVIACKKEKEEPNPLVDTTWKLVGFVDAQADTIKPHSCNTCFLVTFHGDGTLSGRTSTNDAGGTYEITNQLDERINISFQVTTMIGEHPDGHLFIECMNKVTSYSLWGMYLLLYYSPTVYLLFVSESCERQIIPPYYLSDETLAESMDRVFSDQNTLARNIEGDLLFVISNEQEFLAVCDNTTIVSQIDFETTCILWGKFLSYSGSNQILRTNLRTCINSLTYTYEVTMDWCEPCCESCWPNTETHYFWGIYPKINTENISLTIY